MILKKARSHNFFLLICLSIIGILIHYPSFSLVLYGDDWLFIYRYFTHFEPFAHINTIFPGIFAYLAPYGPSIFLIGTEYQIFGQNYFFYYFIAFIFRVFASFALFLVSKRTTRSTTTSFLVACLFLVGFTGIQTTDWVFYSNIYLAVGLFFIGLFFQISFFENKQKKSLWFHFIFSFLAILVGPVRLYPLIFIIPLIDLILLHRNRAIGKGLIFKKIVFFELIITFFWLIGVFGAPIGKIYSPGNWSINDFVNFFVHDPYFTIKSFFYWIGTIFLPDSFITNQEQMAFIGAGLVLTIILIIVRCKKKTWVILSGVTFLIFLLTMWFFSPSRLIGSTDRYLLPTFASGCFLIAILFNSISNSTPLLKRLGYLILVILIVIHATATTNIYKYWLLKGRDSRFINMTDRILLPDFKDPREIIQPSKIFLDFDDNGVLFSVQFGIAFKVLVLSKTYNLKYLPDVFNEKSALKDQVTKEKMQFIDGIFGYQYRNNIFKNTTIEIRKELRDN